MPPLRLAPVSASSQLFVEVLLHGYFLFQRALCGSLCMSAVLSPFVGFFCDVFLYLSEFSEFGLSLPMTASSSLVGYFTFCG